MSPRAIGWAVFIVMAVCAFPARLLAQQTAQSQGQTIPNPYQDAQPNDNDILHSSLRNIGPGYQGMHPYFNEMPPVFVSALVLLCLGGLAATLSERKPRKAGIAAELEGLTQPQIVEYIRARETRIYLQTLTGTVILIVVAVIVVNINLHRLWTVTETMALNVISSIVATVVMKQVRMS